MPETRMVRRRSSLSQLRRLYAHKPIITQNTEIKEVSSSDDVAPIVDPQVRKYLRQDIARTVVTVAVFLILFIILYLTQNSGGVQHAIAWVGSKTSF